ncbi:hypothetical protein [Polynucleobacter sp.]|uniref:hypothetical protein n=1 Tax=Polynucleobacter sp. TaxID=2029855 RepID=UPI003F696384
MINSIFAIVESVLFFVFVGFGVHGFLFKGFAFRPAGIVLATGYVVSVVFFYPFYFLLAGSASRAVIAIFIIALLNNVAYLYYYKFNKLNASRRFHVNKYAYALFLTVLISASFSYIYSNNNQYWHTANEDVFDGLNGRNAFLAGELQSESSELNVDARTRSQLSDKLIVDSGISPVRDAKFFANSYSKEMGTLQYSSLALFSIITGVSKGMDSFVIQALINLGLFALGVFAAVRHVFRQSIAVSVSAATVSALGNFYLTTYLNGHIGSLMYNAVAPFIFVYVARWILSCKQPRTWIFIPLTFLVFIFGAYPYPLMYLALPLCIFALFNWHAKVGSEESATFILKDWRYLLAAILLFSLAFGISYYLGESYREKSLNQFRSWGTSLTYVGFLQYWGIWFSGLTYTTSPLGWMVLKPNLVFASLLLAAILSVISAYGFYKLFTVAKGLLIAVISSLFLFFLVMFYSITDSYYFYKYLYINQWLVFIGLCVGFAHLFKSRFLSLKIASFVIVITWLGLNILNNSLAYWLILDKNFNKNPTIYGEILNAPADLLRSSYVAIPLQDHADIVKQLLNERGIVTTANKREATYLIKQEGIKDIFEDPQGEIVWRSKLYSISRKVEHDNIELATYFGPEGGGTGADKDRQQINIVDRLALKATGFGVDSSQVFRWISDGRNGLVLIDVDNKSIESNYLNFCAMSGPGIGNIPFDLRLIDGNKVEIGKFIIGDYSCNSINVENHPSPFALVHREKAEYVSSLDRRKLVYRIMKIGFSKSGETESLYYNVGGSADIVDRKNTFPNSSVKVRLGSNWYPYEKYQGESFRWVNNDAEIVVSGPVGLNTLSVLVESGPSAGIDGVELRLINEDNVDVGQCHVNGKKSCAFTLNIKHKGPNSFKFKTTSGFKSLVGDPRILNFRIFHIELR